MKGKIVSILLTTFVIFSLLLEGFVATVVSSNTGELAFETDLITWVLGSEPSDLKFDLKVTITDVTNLKTIVFSVEWDPAILNCTSYTPGTFLPAGMPDATGWMITWDRPAGQMQEAANQFMAGYGPISVSSPSWGWVMSLTFQYVGPTPTANSPVDTFINITKNLGAFMDTKWRDSDNVWHDFDYLVGDPYVHTCHFHYGPPLQHELAVTLDAPTFLEPSDSALLNATVFNGGLNNETSVELFLLINDTVVDSATIPELVNGTSHTLSYLWTPTVEATHNVTAYTPPVPDEDVTYNNWDTEFTTVRYAFMIGIIETHGESMYTEELANYYTSLGHVVEKITTTITPEVLSSYDIVIVGERGGTWVPSEIAAVQAYIDSGRVFVAIGDQLGTSVQEILGTYGISYTGISAPGGSSSHFDPLHPIMQDVSLIYASNPVNSLQITAPAYWIANDVSDTYILIAGAEVGGYVLCLSNDFAASLYDDDNKVMFKNIVDWMTVKYEHELTVSLDAPSFLKPSDSSLLNATVRNRGLSNETNVELQLLINGTVVDSIVISELLAGSSYTLSHLWTPTVEGIYNVTAYAPPLPDESITTNNLATKMCAPVPQLAFDEELITWVLGSEPGDLKFDLKINITEVTDLKGMVLSVQWDPSILNCISFTPGTFLPAGLPEAIGWFVTWDLSAGKMHEAANIFLSGYGPTSVSKPSWGWVMTLHFEYVGPTPSMGSPVDTDIVIIKNATDYMITFWRQQGNIDYDFDYLSAPYVHTCHFHYEARPPVGGEAVRINKVIVEPELQIPWMWLSTITLSLVLVGVYVKKRKRHT